MTKPGKAILLIMVIQSRSIISTLSKIDIHCHSHPFCHPSPPLPPLLAPPTSTHAYTRLYRYYLGTLSTSSLPSLGPTDWTCIIFIISEITSLRTLQRYPLPRPAMKTFHLPMLRLYPMNKARRTSVFRFDMWSLQTLLPQIQACPGCSPYQFVENLFFTQTIPLDAFRSHLSPEIQIHAAS